VSEIEHYIGVNLSAGHDESQVKMLMGDLVHTLRDHPGVDYAVLMANGPEVDRPEPTRAELGIIGRERSLIDNLTKKLRASSDDAGHAVSDWTPETKRGAYFEVMIHVDGEPTGHIARVTVELDRFDRDLVETYQREQGKQ
jgi:hypothetical protein